MNLELAESFDMLFVPYYSATLVKSLIQDEFLVIINKEFIWLIIESQILYTF